MKTYQKLRKVNKSTCKTVAVYLKEIKCISRKDMITLMQREKGIPSFYTHPKNFETMFQYLDDHGIMTRENINGLVVWVATQKCIRTHIDNMFIEYQNVSQNKISAAQIWINENKDMFDIDFQSEYVGKKYLELEGDLINSFKKEFKYYNQTLKGDNNYMFYTLEDKKYYSKNSIYYTIENIKEIKVV